MTGGLLAIYVAIIVLAGILSKDFLDIQTVNAIQATLDLPTAITLIAYVGLSIKLEFEKPKYRYLQRSMQNLDMLLVGAGAFCAFALIYLKYFM